MHIANEIIIHSIFSVLWPLWFRGVSVWVIVEHNNWIEFYWKTEEARGVGMEMLRFKSACMKWVWVFVISDRSTVKHE